MTDMINETAPSLDTSSNVSSTPENVVTTAAPETVSHEKTLPQSEVNELVGKIKKETYEKARREVLSEVQKTHTPESISSQQNIGSMPISDDHIRQLITEQANRAAMQAQAERVAHEFNNKMLAAKEKYPDFEQVVAQVNFAQIPSIVNFANSLDNTADIMYDIAKNPSKFASVLTLAGTAPNLAEMELRRLSESIKKNEDASKQPSASEPLSQIRPSITGTDNGSKTIRDLRKESWLRG
jgi:hypothetical protein